MIDVLGHTALNGLVIFFVVSLVRKLPGIRMLSMQGRKPWACNLCMAWWIGVMSELVRMLAFYRGTSYYTAMMSLASMGVAFGLLSAYEALPSPDGPDLPK